MAGKWRSPRTRRCPYRACTAWLLLVSVAPVWWPAGASAQITLHDVTAQTGITFRHTDGGGGQYHIMETVSAGVALLDYNSDGLVDIYFLNGAPLRGTDTSATPRNALYRNEGDWQFTDVTLQAGLGDAGFGLGVVAGDYDHDGDLDIYLNNYGPNVMYRNNGDGTFSDVTSATGTGCGAKVGAGAAFLDWDADGDLDLYVSHYVRFSYDMPRPKSFRGVSVYPSPENYPAEPDTLFRNDGDGTFTDVTTESGVGQYAEWGMGMVCGDFDRDGDTDVFVCNDSTRNLLLQNDGHGHFQDVGLFAGVAYDVNGQRQGSMGVDCADYDNDGWLDLYQTSYQGESATLYRNLGHGDFVDNTRYSGAGLGTYQQVTWGNGFADFDNDGLRDLFVACGHFNDRVDEQDSTTHYEAANILYRNLGKGRFANVSQSGGDGLAVERSSRGIGLDDLDNDGDVDVVVLNSRREPTILRNDSPSIGHWLQVSLVSRRTCAGGVGARVTVTAGDQSWIDEVHCGRGYQSHHGMRLYFGLGAPAAIDRLEVNWIGGQHDIWYNLPVDQRVTVVEGQKEAILW